MKISIRIILILLLLVLLYILYSQGADKKENFKNFNDSDYFHRFKDIKKSKIVKKTKYEDKDDYNDLEIKIPSTDSKYTNLNNYLKKYEINFIYNLEKIDVNIPLVITYDNQSVRNEKNESFVNFLKGLNHYKYNFIVCGINTRWMVW